MTVLDVGVATLLALIEAIKCETSLAKLLVSFGHNPKLKSLATRILQYFPPLDFIATLCIKFMTREETYENNDNNKSNNSSSKSRALIG